MWLMFGLGFAVGVLLVLGWAWFKAAREIDQIMKERQKRRIRRDYKTSGKPT